MIDATSASLHARESRALRRRAAAATDTGEGLALLMTGAAVAMLPFLVPRGPANMAPVDLLMGGAIVAVVLWAASNRLDWRFPYVLPFGIFMLGGALGALVGPVPDAGIVAVVQDFVLIAWCWALVNLCRSPSRALVLVRTWIYSSIAWTVLLFVGLALGATALTGQTAKNASRTALTFVDPNVSANYYFISLMLIWATGYPRRRQHRVAAYAILIAAIISTGSNSGAVSLVVGTVAAAIILVYRRSGTASAVAATAFVLLAAGVLSTTLSMSAIQDRAGESRWSFIREGVGRSDVSVQQREMLRDESLRLYTSGSILGEGPVSTKTRLEHDLAPFAKEAHDDYFAALIERGAIGVLGLLLLVGGIVVRGYAVARTRAAKVIYVVPRPHALAGAVAGTMVAMTVYELLHVRHVWALFALVAALYAWTREWKSPAAS